MWLMHAMLDKTVLDYCENGVKGIYTAVVSKMV